MDGGRAAAQPDPAPEPVPWIQRLLDDEFFLLGVGLMVPVLLYIVWGLMELAQVPLFPR
ncbi:hypothetical protein [Thermaerobacter sp. PB12/4term]|uniref:hypothetical protein n=1 Tax=Thermaerobacter sp. PB12/4term TaxID=2293838 RepID=UPI00193FE261|nr:hypothetical protein [Thermaerobacter sp. PB12/4term]